MMTLATWPVEAQPLGTFTWQLQPFCNVVTVNVTQQGAVYTMDGYDDQCGTSRRAPLVGLGTPNPDGTIGLGWNIITTPGGRGMQVDARITLPSASGSWSDSAGNTGTLALGASTGGHGATAADNCGVGSRARSRCSPTAASWRAARWTPAPFPRPGPAPV